MFDAFRDKLASTKENFHPLLSVDFMSLDFSYNGVNSFLPDKDFSHVFNINCIFECHINLFYILEGSRSANNI